MAWWPCNTNHWMRGATYGLSLRAGDGGHLLDQHCSQYAYLGAVDPAWQQPHHLGVSQTSGACSGGCGQPSFPMDVGAGETGGTACLCREVTMNRGANHRSSAAHALCACYPWATERRLSPSSWTPLRPPYPTATLQVRSARSSTTTSACHGVYCHRCRPLFSQRAAEIADQVVEDVLGSHLLRKVGEWSTQARRGSPQKT